MLRLSRREACHALLAALLGSVLTSCLLFPGWASVDSLQQYLQATGRLRLDDVHPPWMAGVWHVTDRFVPGTGGLFLLFVAAWWVGLAACIWQLFAPGWRRVCALLLVGLWPAALLMLAHVWKDVGMCASLLLALAACIAARRSGSRWHALLAVLGLMSACAFRHNGMLAALPLLWWLCWPRRSIPGSRWRHAFAGLLLSLLLVLTPGIASKLSGAVRSDAWTAVALWDIGAISIASGEMLMPRSVTMPDLDIEQLQHDYRPWANPPLFDSGKILLSLFVPYSAEQRADVAATWWRAVQVHPRAYLAHRAAMSRYLLFGYRPDLPHELVFVSSRLVDADEGPGLQPVAHDNPMLRFALSTWTTSLFAGALYLAFVLAACVGVLRASRRTIRAPVLALVASALGNAVPLAVIAGAAEFRYLLWSVLASLLALLLAWMPAPGTVSPAD